MSRFNYAQICVLLVCAKWRLYSSIENGLERETRPGLIGLIFSHSLDISLDI